ncbi:terpene cyclase/mutase family protein [Desmospora profundinema]|uniref:Sporulenol synthase n=1 Tax=Desmospora profundinema TaxID=1571184 RepID=A0ABU1INQ7_9BACL|nr:prenyltransferase/squalene oxidase repeat-containing protein [Desmospora profundinema]MDR6226429.1 sporulenol synthase [Desmospora profundinema]
MDPISVVRAAREQLMDEVLRKQKRDGRWSLCFETGPMTDAYTLLLMEGVGWRDPKLREGIVSRLRALADRDGGWRLYADEPHVNVSATVEASVALVAAGAESPDGTLIRQAQERVRSQGGIRKAGSLTRIVLSLVGMLDWGRQPRLPIRLLLLPWWFPVNLFDLVGFTRCHLVPVMVASHLRVARSLPRGPHDLTGWGMLTDSISISPTLQRHIQDSLPAELSGKVGERLALAKAAAFMRNRTEADGTLYSYFSTTLLMVFAWLGLGFSPSHPWITQAIRGVRSFVIPTAEGLHMQFTTSTVWDTALLMDALGEAGIPPQDEAMVRGRHYVLTRQHTRLGDWAIKNPGVPAGGWGFSDINTINPDVDDTAACLRVLARGLTVDPSLSGPWERGVRWLTSMQNRDGGWAAFEKNTDKRWPQLLLPAEDLKMVATDPSTVDLTGRTLAFLGRYRGWKQENPAAERAIRFLEKVQEKDGSWFGRWGIAYIYGTWAALTGMTAVGCTFSHPAVAKGVRWLLSVQNPDGGWGESCRSDGERRYVPLNKSTPSQTAWALDALIACHDHPTAPIQAGIQRLASLTWEKGEHITYPTGAGMAGQFYIHYHSYRYIWPLGVLARYEKKYGSSAPAPYS